MKLIGIDPGHQTGFAVWDAFAKKLLEVKALPIHRALEEVEDLHRSTVCDIAVIFEDARQRTWFGRADASEKKYGAAIREGVGSVKRDCVIWQEYLIDRGIAHVARKPIAGGTKWPAVQFARATGWSERTNEHGRDAAMLVFGTPHNVALQIFSAYAQAIAPGIHAHATART